MLRKNPGVAAYISFLYLFLIRLPCNVSAEYDHSCPQTSSCGSHLNISYPFRLKDDPPKCGDRNYELTCENNQTLILSLFSGKYQVKFINYTEYTIELFDVGFQDGNGSTFYSHSIGDGNYTYSNPLANPDPFSARFNSAIMFVSCETPQISHLYIDSSPCFTTNKHSYVLLDDTASIVGDSCTIDMILHGFFNPEECKEQSGCYYNRTNSVVTCIQPSSLKLSLFPLCRFLGEQLVLFAEYVFYYPVVFPYYIGGLVITPIELLFLARFMCGGICVLVLLCCKWRKRHASMYDSIEEFLKNNSDLMPIRYSYKQIKRMTNNFEDKLGEGGYGSVYKGKLRSGYLVAVKILGKSEATGQDFMNEVATIGRIHHVNVVRLIGFCVQGSKRALVYDFMPNGSLEKYIFGREGYASLGCEQMFEISVGIARGIEYLHRGCDMQILHFDIKPHNILLDENFVPKLSDFGLAKLYPTTRNTVTLTAARGTIGYIAPELLYKNIGGVSYKADVYSFGMLLMEIAGKRKKFSPVTEHSSRVYFPFCVHDQIVNEKEVEIQGSEEGKRSTKKMVIVALWCIQMNPSNRPPMNKVLEMLEENIENLKVPPKSSLYHEENLVNDDTNPSWPSFTTVGPSNLIKSAP